MAQLDRLAVEWSGQRDGGRHRGRTLRDRKTVVHLTQFPHSGLVQGVLWQFKLLTSGFPPVDPSLFFMRYDVVSE